MISIYTVYGKNILEITGILFIKEFSDYKIALL